MTEIQHTHRRQGHRMAMQMLTADQLQHLKPSKGSARFLIVEIDPDAHHPQGQSHVGNNALRKKLTDMVNDPAVDPNTAMQMLEIAWDRVTKSAGVKVPVAAVDIESEASESDALIETIYLLLLARYQ